MYAKLLGNYEGAREFSAVALVRAEELPAGYLNAVPGGINRHEQPMGNNHYFLSAASPARC